MFSDCRGFVMGMPPGTPLAWHLKTAMVLAGQLPDNPDDARIVLHAMQNLLENFLSKTKPVEDGARPSNVLPFTG